VRSLFLSIALAAAPLTTSAHEMATGPNGGPVVDSSGHHVEMVAKGAELVLFLTGEGEKPLASAGAIKARAIVQDQGQTATVALHPAEPNKLVGALLQPLGNGARVVVSATMADGHIVQARFVNH
jgi:hypothetical protein